MESNHEDFIDRKTAIDGVGTCVAARGMTEKIRGMEKSAGPSGSGDDIPVFPPELWEAVSSVEEGQFVNIETTDFVSEHDVQQLVEELFRRPDVDYYFFEEEGTKNPF